MPINLGILYALKDGAGLHPTAAAAIAVVIAISFNYLINHYWTFKDRQTDTLGRGYIKYMLVGSISESVYLGIYHIAVVILNFNYLLSAGILIILLGLLRYYIVGRWIWRTKEKSSQSQAPRCPTEMRNTSLAGSEKIS